MNKNQISPNFTLSELTVSQTAARAGIDNTPDAVTITHLQKLCNDLLEPLREYLGVPTHVSSGYRSPWLNKMIGGAHDAQGNQISAHCYGYAADITAPSFGSVPDLAKKVVELLRAHEIKFDQVILEFGGWVHVAVCSKDGYQRGQVLTAKRVNGKATYYAGLI